MTTELALLAWSVVLGLVHAVLTGQLAVQQFGLWYNMGPRDEGKQLTGVPARIQRAFANYMQTFPFFAAAVLIAQVAGRHGTLTVLGAHLYFWARLVYVPLYALGIPVVRTLAFGIATLGIVLILVALT
jgi:uncharacterized MAPEG superfamily protein